MTEPCGHPVSGARSLHPGRGKCRWRSSIASSREHPRSGENNLDSQPCCDEREGLIEVTSVDGRTRNVRISTAGTARLKQALLLWDQAQQTLRNKLGEKAWSILQDTLAHLAKVA